MMADEIAKSNTQSKSEIQKEIRQQNDFTTLADTLENKYKPYFSEAVSYTHLDVYKRQT